MKKKAIKFAKVLLPEQSRRRVWTKHFLLQTSLFTRFIEDAYQTWIQTTEPNRFIKPKAHKYSPLISVLVPAYNTPDKYLLPLVDSVKNQTYTNWELCIADGSTDIERSNAVKNIAAQDKRIKYIKLRQNKGISANTNEALAVAKGEFIAFLDHDDQLAPAALNEVVAVLQTRPDLDLIYSDEDLISDNGKKRFNPFFKPDWSPDLLWALNYITHFVVARRSLAEKIGGLRPEFDGAQDYDFLLRLTEKTKKIHHIPKILYHWRMAENSTAKHGINSKSAATEAGRLALQEALKRRQLQGKVKVDENRLGNYKVAFGYSKQPKAALIIPQPVDSKRFGAFLTEFLDRTNYKNLEILLNYLPLDLHTNTYVVKELKPQTENSFWHDALNQTNAEIIIGLQKSYMPQNSQWLTELAGTLQQEHIGAATGLVLDKAGRVYDYGMYLKDNQLTPAFRGIKHTQPTLNGFISWPRNYTALSGGIFVARRNILLENLKGEHIQNDLLQSEFFKYLTRLDLYNLAWPHAIFETTNQVVWQTDPFFNSNLLNEYGEINFNTNK